MGSEVKAVTGCTQCLLLCSLELPMPLQRLATMVDMDVAMVVMEAMAAVMVDMVVMAVVMVDTEFMDMESDLLNFDIMVATIDKTTTAHKVVMEDILIHSYVC